jgi:HEAT repeat protein
MKRDPLLEKLRKLEALRAIAGSSEALPLVRKALHERSSLLVEKAASIVQEKELAGLAPDVVAAFTRFLEHPSDDPGCRAKIALARALSALDHRDPEPFERGAAHVQREPVWGKLIDVAGPVRGICVQALIGCAIDHDRLLRLYVDRFADDDKVVRTEVAAALAQLGGTESILLLRLKALAGDAEPEVVGQCLLSLLDREPEESVGFVARFLDAPSDELRFEAVSALGQARSAAALPHVERFWADERLSTDLRLATVGALAASPRPESSDFLLRAIGQYPGRIAEAAVAAACASRFAHSVRDRLRSAVAASGDDGLARAFEGHNPTDR